MKRAPWKSRSKNAVLDLKCEDRHEDEENANPSKAHYTERSLTIANDEHEVDLILKVSFDASRELGVYRLSESELCTKSKYFETLLSPKWTKSHESMQEFHITIDDINITREAFEVCLQHSIHPNIDLPQHLLFQILATSTMLQNLELATAAMKEIALNITEHTVVDTLNLAHQYNNVNLLQESVKWLRKNLHLFVATWNRKASLFLTEDQVIVTNSPLSSTKTFPLEAIQDILIEDPPLPPIDNLMPEPPTSHLIECSVRRFYSRDIPDETLPSPLIWSTKYELISWTNEVLLIAYKLKSCGDIVITSKPASEVASTTEESSDHDDEYTIDPETVVARAERNFSGTEFSFYDNGFHALTKETMILASRLKTLRRRIGAVVYQYNFFYLNGPRRMTVLLPENQLGLYEVRADQRNVWREIQHEEQEFKRRSSPVSIPLPEDGSLMTSTDAIALDLDDRNSANSLGSTRVDDASESLIQRYARGDNQGLRVYKNKTPRWSTALNAYSLNFGGRVTHASVKNFQLIDRPDNILMQFGRTGQSTFSLDYKPPLNYLQAFCIALSTFDYKFCCD